MSRPHKLAGDMLWDSEAFVNPPAVAVIIKLPVRTLSVLR